MTTLITLTGTYGKLDDNPATGYVDIVPAVTSTLAQTVVVQDPVKATLDGDGKFSVQIVASDNTGWVGGPIPYIFREFVNGEVQQWMAYVNAPGPVDISSLVPLDQAPDVYIPVPGPPNVLTVQSTTTIMPGLPAEVQISGDSPSQELNFWIPQGERGVQGPPGPPGTASDTTDHGVLSGLGDDDHPQYHTDARGDLRYDALGAADAEVGLHEAAANPHPQYSMTNHVHPSTTSVREFLLYDATSAPPPGAIYLSVAGQVRTFRASKTDADGVPYSLAPMLPGDGVTLTDDPDSPPITGFARYTVTSEVLDMGTYWQFTALRTDTSGSQTITPGVRVRFIPTMSAGLVGEASFPAYITAGADNVGGIGTLWQRVISMPYDLPAGTYEIGFAVEWISDVADQTFFVRLSGNNGASWRSYTKRNTDVQFYQTWFYQYPVTNPTGQVSSLLLEAKSGSGTSDIEFSDVWIRRVA